MNEDWKIKKFKSNLNYELESYYRNHNRLAIYIVVNRSTADLIVSSFGGGNVDSFGTIFYQNYKIAVDNGLGYLEFKVLGD